MLRIPNLLQANVLASHLHHELPLAVPSAIVALIL